MLLESTWESATPLCMDYRTYNIKTLQPRTIERI